MLGDKAYDSTELREELDERGTKPVIPNRCNRKQPFGFATASIVWRWRMENAFNRQRGFRVCHPPRGWPEGLRLACGSNPEEPGKPAAGPKARPGSTDGAKADRVSAGGDH
jgi:hypothetical protein